MSRMTGSDPKADLKCYLQTGRDPLLWKLEGLSDYDVRRPLVPTGTNLLGLVKHAGSASGRCSRRGRRTGPDHRATWPLTSR